MEQANNVTPISSAQNSFDELNRLAGALYRMRQQRDEISAEIAELETKIISMVGHKEEGKATVHTDDFDIETNGKLTRSLDQKAIPKIANTLPAQLFDMVFKHSYKLDLKNYRHMQNNEPEVFAVIKDAVTTKEAKTGLVIKPNSEVA